MRIEDTDLLRGVRPLPEPIERWRQIFRNIRRQPPPTLFHYTNADGLTGILRSKQIWATHIDYTNDTSEFTYAKHIINDVLASRLENEAPDSRRKLSLVLDRYNAVWQNAVSDTYIACFCEHGNLLSQWRAYANNGGGFSLGLDWARLRLELERADDVRQNSAMFKVIYDARDQRDLVMSAVGHVMEAFSHEEEEVVLAAVPYAFSEMHYSFKHEGFAEEQEWRLVFVPGSNDLVDVRVLRGQLLPFAKIPICSGQERPPYTQVIHGPTLNARNTIKAVKTLIGREHPAFATAIAITGSDVPLRST